MAVLHLGLAWYDGRRTGADVPLGGLPSRAFDAGIELAGDAARDAMRRAFPRK